MVVWAKWEGYYPVTVDYAGSKPVTTAKFAKDSIQHNNFFSAKKREGFDSPVGVDAR